MATTYPPTEFPLVLTAVLLLVVFAAAEFTAHYTVVYRRNNLGVVVALLLSAAAVWLFTWVGFVAFAAGTLSGAWTWVSGIRTANENVHQAGAALTQRVSPTTANVRQATRA